MSVLYEIVMETNRTNLNDTKGKDTSVGEGVGTSVGICFSHGKGNVSSSIGKTAGDDDDEEGSAGTSGRTPH